MSNLLSRRYSSTNVSVSVFKLYILSKRWKRVEYNYILDRRKNKGRTKKKNQRKGRKQRTNGDNLPVRLKKKKCSLRNGQNCNQNLSDFALFFTTCTSLPLITGSSQLLTLFSSAWLHTSLSSAVLPSECDSLISVKCSKQGNFLSCKFTVELWFHKLDGTIHKSDLKIQTWGYFLLVWLHSNFILLFSTASWILKLWKSGHRLTSATDCILLHCTVPCLQYQCSHTYLNNTVWEARIYANTSYRTPPY